MGSPPQRTVGKQGEDRPRWEEKNGRVGIRRSRRRRRWWKKRASAAWRGAIYALGLGLPCVLVEPLLPWMVRLTSSFLSFSFSFSSSFSSSLSAQASRVSSAGA